ncbi:lipopolysaccharide heptosyltransferase I [Nautilia lithotrophica]
MDLIVRLSALGDIIHTAIVLQFLPEKIDWVVEEGFAEILEYNPKINKILRVNLKSIKKSKSNIFKEYKKIKKFGVYDNAIDFQGLIKSAVVARILGNEVIGRENIREKLAKIFYDKKIKTSDHTIGRYRDMINEIYGLNISEEEFINHKPFLFYKEEHIKKEYLSDSKKNIVFIIGSTAPNRQYPTEKWIKLANKLNENILIPYGNEKEKLIAKDIANNSDAKIMDKMSLNELKATLSSADLIIGNDTGPSYIGWANNVPTILLYGTTPISRIYENKTTKIIKSKTAKYLDKLDKNDFSIKDIDVEEILEKIDEF